MNNIKSTGAVICPENSKVEFIDLPTVAVQQFRYDRLIAAETELELIKSYLSTLRGYTDIEVIKQIFNIKKGNKNE